MFVFQISTATDLSQVFAKSLSPQRIVPSDDIFDYVKEWVWKIDFLFYYLIKLNFTLHLL